MHTLCMTTRVPMSIASRKGVSWLAKQAQEKPITLTSFGRPSAVVIAASNVDATGEVGVGQLL